MAVLGAGVAGLAAADRLIRAGWRVRVIDGAAGAGGAHRARHIGPYTFDVGSMFYEHDARLFDLAPRAQALCPRVIRIQRRIAPDGSVRRYPFDPGDLHRGTAANLVRAVLDLAWSRLTVGRDGTLDAMLRRRLGGTLFEATGLAAYIARFHHAPPREIDEAFFFHRMAFVDRATRIGALPRMALRALRAAPPATGRRRPLHVRPREGFEPMFDPIVARLRAAGVEFGFGEQLSLVQRHDGGFIVCTPAGTFPAAGVVSTIPLDTLHRAMFGHPSGLASLGMTTLFVSARWLDPRLGNVLYNFHRAGRWKRATAYSRIYPSPGIAREYLAVEITTAPGARHQPEAAFEDFRHHLAGLGLAEDLVLEGHEAVDDCYPLYRAGSAVELSEVLRRIEATGVILAGRQGRFEYLPTSSGVIRRVAEELDASGLLARAGIAA